MSKNLSELSGRQGIKNNLFDRLGKLSIENDGTPDPKKLDELAEEFLFGKANTYGTTTFYDFLKPENKGKKVYVCNGSACLCAGTQEELKTELKKHYKESEIGHMCCLGRCHENSAFHIDGNNYSAKSIDEIASIIKSKKAKPDNYNVKSIGESILTKDFPGVKAYYETFVDAIKDSPKFVLEHVKGAGKRGRGGAGFPMGTKWEFCAKAKGDQKFIICNADEGDPGAFSDRYLLEERPHSVLFGMMIGGYSIGAEWGIVYIRAEYPESVRSVEKAIQELRDNDLLGKDIYGSGFNFDFKVIHAQGSYICGEETALINSIEGQRPEVRTRPPFPAQTGLFNKPTIVNNVETLASVHFMFDQGIEAFRSYGTKDSTGTKLVSLDGYLNKPGLYEVPMGYSFKKLIYEDAGGFRKPVKAIHVGGPLGGLVPVSKIGDLTIDFESFAKEGFLLGHAGTVCIPEDFPIVKYIEHLFEFAADESCGKCFPCRLGTHRGYEMFKKVQEEKDYKLDPYLVDDLLHTLEIGSLCAHGGGIPLPVKNALHNFKDELKAYFK